jgi:general secretion pathway protein J
MRRARGFTLIEVLVALAITAFVAAAAYSGISTVLGGTEQLREAATRTRELNRALAIINRDLRQFVDRPVRDEFGERQPALSGGPLAWFPLTLTRGGWHNSLELPRSDLQRVHYYLEDGSLWRAYYPVLDRLANTPRLAVRLLDDVERIELRFLRDIERLRVDRDGVVDSSDWERNWVDEVGGGTATLLPPIAVELRLELADLGLLRRLYVLPAR